MTEEEQAGPPLPRLETGVPGLDLVLGGGLVAGGLYLFEGRPGTGKTILANQICFHCARSGERALYVTLLAESHGKMLKHLRSLTFYGESLVYRAVNYLSGYQALVEHGVSGLLAMLGAAVREHAPSLLVIDGVRSARAFADTENAFAVFIHELNAFITAARCTTLLLAPEEGERLQPEQVLVDGLIALYQIDVGLRTVRELEVRKQRGSAHRDGRHLFTITGAGLTVFPRLEGTLDRFPRPAATDRSRVPFDIPRLDAMLDGGMVAGSTTSLVGPPGAGKTILGLKFLEAGVRRGEPSLCFGFYETPERLLSKAESVGIEIGEAVSSGLLRLIWHASIEQMLDEMAAKLLADVEGRQVRRIFIDGIEGFRDAAVYPERAPRFMVALTTALRGLGATTLMTEEIQSPPIDVRPLIATGSAVVENQIVLRYFEVGARIHRLISISKSRDSPHALVAREFHIVPGGFELETSHASAQALLAGTAPAKRAASRAGARRARRRA